MKGVAVMVCGGLLGALLLGARFESIAQLIFTPIFLFVVFLVFGKVAGLIR